MPSAADHDRFLALLEEHKGILYKVANGYCRHREDRQDLIQEIIVQLWRSFDRFDQRYRFSTWMYRIAMNVAISFYRSERRRIRDAVSIQEWGIDIAGADEAVAEAPDDVRLLHRLIQELDEMNRALILLYLDDCDYQTIAEIVGISVTNVGTRLHRIKQQLQRELALQNAKQENQP
jgi:RNA polymerase sigma-70 factor (ECF subfamily)